MLLTLETTCEAIGTFWIVEAGKFSSQGANLSTNQQFMKTEKVAELNKEFWTKAKEDIDRYVQAMSVINNCYNFETDANGPELKMVTYDKLDFVLYVPTSVNTEC